MAPPTSPYCATTDVAILMPQLLLGGTDFSTATQPTKVVVTTFTNWISAQIDQAIAVDVTVKYGKVFTNIWLHLLNGI